MSLWKADVDKLLPGHIYTEYEADNIEECDKLRVVKIMAQSQNWNCTEEEAIERIKKSSYEEPFTIDGEKFWYES